MNIRQVLYTEKTKQGKFKQVGRYRDLRIGNIGIGTTTQHGTLYINGSIYNVGQNSTVATC